MSVASRCSTRSPKKENKHEPAQGCLAGRHAAAPQHFQQSDRYYDHQLKARTQKLSSHAWGFFNLEIDRQFLNMGKLVLSRASGILPDGTLFELGSEREPLALDIPPNTGSTPVYLALPLVTGNHIETRRPEQKDVLARYTAHELDVADSNAGDSSTSRSAPVCQISACCWASSRATEPT